MASLESLSNPLEALNVQPSALNLRQRDSATGPTPLWNATVQYYTNDVVLSPINGGAYVYTGNSAALISGDRPKSGVLGGPDPALDATGGWQSLAGGAASGIFGWEAISPTFAAQPVGPGNFTVTAGGSLTVPSGSSWLAIASGTFTTVAVGGPPPVSPALTAPDSATLTLTGSAGGTTLTLDVVPNANGAATATRWSGSGVVSVGAGAAPFTITVAGSCAGPSGIQPSAVNVTLIRLF